MTVRGVIDAKLGQAAMCGAAADLEFGRRLLNRRAAPFGTFPALFVTGVVLVRAGRLGVATKNVCNSVQGMLRAG